MEIGQSLGLSGRFVYQSDAQFVDILSYIQKIVQHTPLSVIPSAVFPSSVRRSSMALVLNPAQSETKEFTIIVGLSTKGMMHSLSKKMITEHQISSQFSQVQTVLSQLEKANIVEITGMTKGSSGSELQKIQSIIVLGKKSSSISSSSESAPSCWAVRAVAKEFLSRQAASIKFNSISARLSLSQLKSPLAYQSSQRDS